MIYFMIYVIIDYILDLELEQEIRFEKLRRNYKHICLKVNYILFNTPREYILRTAVFVCRLLKPIDGPLSRFRRVL